MFKAFLYAVFALLSIVTNIAVQNLVFWAVPGDDTIFIAMPVGAVVGLFLKFRLDKRYIFMDRRGGGQKFLKYAVTGGFLTALFFAAEYAAWAVFASPRLRDLGALAGLTLGYAIKFELDRRFVFEGRPARSPAG